MDLLCTALVQHRRIQFERFREIDARVGHIHSGTCRIMSLLLSKRWNVFVWTDAARVHMYSRSYAHYCHTINLKVKTPTGRVDGTNTKTCKH